MRERPDIRKRLKNSKESDITRPLSVLMLSIDSVSRLNLIRTMPNTAGYLKENQWFELQGYNKVNFILFFRAIGSDSNNTFLRVDR